MSSLSHTWRDELRRAHPKIFARPCELSVGPGWRVLVDELCTALQWQTDHNGAPQLVAIQVKSKLGELRFYADAVGDRVEAEPPSAIHIHRHDRNLVISRSAGSRAQDAITELASALSRRTCEVCGALGTEERDRMWVAVRCSAHRGQRIEDDTL
jgi:hypothetical protein